jgi:hypothetical protein
LVFESSYFELEYKESNMVFNAIQASDFYQRILLIFDTITSKKNQTMQLKHFLFLLSLIGPGLMKAQDYLPFKLNNTSLYINASSELQAIRIDSVIALGKDTLYKNFPSIVPSGNSYCRGSWVFTKLLKKNKGACYLYKSDYDSLLFPYIAGLNQSWIMKVNADKSSLQATVTTIAAGTFLGISDSIKTINVIKLDSLGKNGVLFAEYGLSKKNGLVSYNLYDNNKIYQKYTLAGTSNPMLGLQNFTAKDIFDYAIGDEFLVQSVNGYYTSTGVIQNITLKKTKILNKRMSLNGDTIVYTDSLYTRYTSITYKGTTQVNTIKYNKGVVSDVVYLKKNNLNLLPYELQTPVNGNVITLKYDLASNTLVKNSDPRYSSYENKGCFNYLLLDGYPDNFHYFKGLGGAYYDTYTTFGSSNELLYYKKGSVAWGTPVSQGELTSVMEVQTSVAPAIIFPNPFSKSAVLDLSKNTAKELVTFSLFDFLGKEVMHLETTENKIEIERGNLESGMYLYSVSKNSQFIQMGKVVIQ